MASVAVSATATAFSWNPFIAIPAIAIAAYIDQRYIYPSLAGKGKAQAEPNPLVSLPQTTSSPGTPRVWACGRRIRIPLHVMYQSEKTREDSAQGSKGGVAQRIKRVFADVGISVNDRPTRRLTQLIANGQLIYWTDKNLVRVTTDQMTGTWNTTTIATGAVAAGSTTLVVQSAAPIVGSHGRVERWLQITSGPLALQARPINSNTAAAFTVDSAFTAAPGVGVTYAVIEKRLLLTMNSSYEPDFTDYFEQGDYVDLRGFSCTPAGPNLANCSPFSSKSWWRIQTITAHGATPSSITLEAIMGQDIGPLTAVQAGTSFSPGSIVREDEYLFLDPVRDVLNPAAYPTPFKIGTFIAQYVLNPTPPPLYSYSPRTTQDAQRIAKHLRRFLGTTNYKYVRPYHLLAVRPLPFGTTTALTGQAVFSMQPFLSGYTTPDYGVGNGPRWEYPTALGGPLAGDEGYYYECANRVPVFVPYANDRYEPGMFASDPVDSYYNGSETQTEDDIILRTKTGGEIPGYRGLAYQMLDQWDLSTYFGNQVAPILEAIIEPDALYSVRQAISDIVKRAQSQDIIIDTDGVDAIPCEGFWTQGAIPTVTALQPILTAYSIAVQERNDTLAFLHIENADSVQIENGPVYSDLGVRSGQDTPSAGDKLRIIKRDIQELPTTIGVTHQDPDQQYAQGFQHFKQRQPSPLASANEQTLQLSNVVLSRKQARNLAATVMRRAWVNATALELQLPVAYCELLENDLITLTDDNNVDYVARIIRREIGANFVVNCYAVVEDVDLEVRGSPVQGPSDLSIGTPVAVAITERVFDIPALADADVTLPGYYVGAAAGLGQTWRGATVYESRDSGNTWQQVAVLNNTIGIGTLVSTLPSGTPSDGIGSVIWDATNSFTATFESYGQAGVPVTMTTGDVLDGWNWMLIQDGSNFEVVGARDVVDNGDGTLTFSYLLRGLRGTYDSSATTKAIGSEVTLLFGARQQEAIKFIPLNVSAANLPISLQIKFVPPGMSLVDVTAQSVTINAWNARPMPGRMFSTDLDLGTYDRTFTFAPWTRLQTPVGGGGPYNLDETFEGYSVRIYDPTGATLMRTKTISSGPTGANRIRGVVEFVYTAAEQTTDGYTPGPSETFKVERVQLGDFGEGRTWMEDV